MDYKKTIRPVAVQIGLSNLTHQNFCDALCIPKSALERVTGKNFTSWVEFMRADNVPLGTPEPRGRIHNPAIRRELLLDTALELAEAAGLDRLSAPYIAAVAGVSRTLVQKYLDGRPLREVVVAHAVARSNATVVAEGLRLGVELPSQTPATLLKRARTIARAELK